MAGDRLGEGCAPEASTVRRMVMQSRPSLSDRPVGEGCPPDPVRLAVCGHPVEASRGPRGGRRRPTHASSLSASPSTSRAPSAGLRGAAGRSRAAGTATISRAVSQQPFWNRRPGGSSPPGGTLSGRPARASIFGDLDPRPVADVQDVLDRSQRAVATGDVQRRRGPKQG